MMLSDYLSAVLALFDGTVKAMLSVPLLGVFLAALLLLMVFFLVTHIASSLHGGQRNGR